MDNEVKWYGNELLGMVRKRNRKALSAAGRLIKSRARRLAPVGMEVRAAPAGGPAWKARTPGSLKKSIRSKLVKKGTGVQVIAGNYLVFYAKWVEFGTHKMAAETYLRAALEQSAGEVRQRFEGWFK